MKNGPSVVVDHKFTVVPPRFGIVLPLLNYDKPAAAPPPAPPVAVPGQQLLFFCGVVGFDAKPGKTPQDNLQTDVTLELTILDESGKPTLTKPFGGGAQGRGARRQGILADDVPADAEPERQVHHRGDRHGQAGQQDRQAGTAADGRRCQVTRTAPHPSPSPPRMGRGGGVRGLETLR